MGGQLNAQQAQAPAAVRTKRSGRGLRGRQIQQPRTAGLVGDQQADAFK